MHRFVLLPLLLLLWSPQATESAPANPDLVGIWQCSPEIAAGWNEVYRFFEDGTVIWHNNQMDLEKRLLERRGAWRLKGDRLRVEFTEETVLAGGTHVKPEDQAEGESVWDGAKEIKRKLSKPIVQETILTTPARRDHYPSLFLFERRFWKIRENPADYE